MFCNAGVQSADPEPRHLVPGVLAIAVGVATVAIKISIAHLSARLPRLAAAVRSAVHCTCRSRFRTKAFAVERSLVALVLICGEIIVASAVV